MSKLYYYILLDPDKPSKTKVGITKNPSNRIKAYRTAAPHCTFYALYEIPHRIHEKKILDILKDIFIVQRELVHCQPHFVKNVVDDYLNSLELN